MWWIRAYFFTFQETIQFAWIHMYFVSTAPNAVKKKQIFPCVFPVSGIDTVEAQIQRLCENNAINITKALYIKSILSIDFIIGEMKRLAQTQVKETKSFYCFYLLEYSKKCTFNFDFRWVENVFGSFSFQLFDILALIMSIIY